MVLYARTMARKLVHVTFALAAAFLLFFAIGYEGWDCKGGILSDECQNEGPYKVTANSAILLAGILLIFLTVFKLSWSAKVAFILAVISAALSIAGLVYYANARKHWSPFIATAAMTLMTALFSILIFDLASKY